MWESTIWLAGGASAAAALALAAAVAVVLRRRSRVPDPRPEELERAWDEVRRQRSAAARARDELRWRRQLAEAGPLQDVLRRALEAGAGLAGGAAALLVLPQPDGDPLVAAVGLSATESTRELLGLVPAVEARAVTFGFRYDDELDGDEFRLSGGVAVPVPRPEDADGLLAVFWRRVEREATEEELVSLEGLAAALGPALAGSLRFEEVRRELDVDAVTGLPGRRSLSRALEVECARARRYGHPLALVLLRLEAPLRAGALHSAAEGLRREVRTSDLVCHLGDGRFAALLPEASRGDAERLGRRLELVLAPRIEAGSRTRLPVVAAGLEAVDDAVSLLARAETALARAVVAGGTEIPAHAAVEPGA